MQQKVVKENPCQVQYSSKFFLRISINQQMNMEIKDFLAEELQLTNLTDENKVSVLNEKIQEIDHLRNQMNIIKEEIIDKLNEEDVKRWKSYIPSLQEIVSNISKRHGLKAEILWVNEEINSHLCISFYMEGWDLSIVFEKFDYKRKQIMFEYIGIPAEKRVDPKYSYMKIFKESSEKPNHPYGWEWVDKYCGKPGVLQEDIDNGGFQSFLEQEVGNILNKIEENRLPMK